MSFPTKGMYCTNWQIGLLKISMIACGIILGSYFADFWKPILWIVWVIFIVAGTWVSLIWLKAMKKSGEEK